MSATSIATAAGRRAVRRTAFTGGSPQAGSLAQHVAGYVPADVIAVYVPIASIFSANSGVTADTKRLVAIALSVVAAAYVLGRAWWEARMEAASADPPTNVKPSRVLQAAAFPLVAAGIASFAWATAMPGSWFDWTALQGFQVILVSVTALLLGILGSFIAPLPKKD